MHVIPLDFKVDGQIVKNPVGAFGSHLEVFTHLILCPSETIMLLTQVLRQLQLQIGGLVFDPLASSQVFLTPEERENGVLFFDIGGRFTKVNFVKNHKLYRSALLPVGGETFTSDLAQCLNSTVPEAERLKIVYGDVILGRVDNEKLISINTKSEGRMDVKKMKICQVLEARLKELLQMARKEMASEMSANLPIVIGGGGALLTGLPDYFRNEFRVSVRQGLPDEIRSVLDNAGYASAIGLVLYGIKSKAIVHEEKPAFGFTRVAARWMRGVLG
jgi:cell division protein FtsA